MAVPKVMAGIYLESGRNADSRAGAEVMNGWVGGHRSAHIRLQLKNSWAVPRKKTLQKKWQEKKKKLWQVDRTCSVRSFFFFFNCSLIQSCGESQTERRRASSGRRNYRMQTPSVSQSVTGCRSRLCWRGRHEKKSNTKLCMSIITCLILFAIHSLSINSVSSLLIGIKHWLFFFLPLKPNKVLTGDTLIS